MMSKACKVARKFITKKTIIQAIVYRSPFNDSGISFKSNFCSNKPMCTSQQLKELTTFSPPPKKKSRIRKIFGSIIACFKIGIVLVILDGVYESGVFGESNEVQQIAHNVYVDTVDPVIVTCFGENVLENPAGNWNKIVVTIFGFVLETAELFKDIGYILKKRLIRSISNNTVQSISVESDEANENDEGNETEVMSAGHDDDETVVRSGDDEESSIESDHVEGSEVETRPGDGEENSEDT